MNDQPKWICPHCRSHGAYWCSLSNADGLRLYGVEAGPNEWLCECFSCFRVTIRTD